MQYKSIKGFTGPAQIGILLVFIGLGMVVAGSVQMALAYTIIPEGTPLASMEKALLEALKDPRNVGIGRWMQVLGTFILLFIPTLLYSWICNGKQAFWLGFNKHLNVFQVLLAFLLIFTANIMAAPLEELIKKMVVHFPSVQAVALKLENTYNEQVLLLSNLRSVPEFLLALLIMAFFPAVFEEVFFRAAVQNLLVKWWGKPLLAIVITSLLFSLIHMSVYLFLSRAILGFVLGLMYYQTKNIWVNIIAHFLNNALALAQLFAMTRNNQPVDINQLNPTVEWWFGLIALATLFILFTLLKRYSEKNRMRIYAKEQAMLVAAPNGNPLAN